MASIESHVTSAIDDFNGGKVDNALMHACIAVDGSAQKFFSQKQSSRSAYKNFLRNYYWIIQSMVGGAIDISTTKFENIKTINGISSPDLADIIYHIFRCIHLHGNPVPMEFDLTPVKEGASSWTFAGERLNIPDRLVWALLAVVVLSTANKDIKSGGDYYLTLGSEAKGHDVFQLTDWWGREKDFVPFTDKHANPIFTVKYLD